MLKRVPLARTVGLAAPRNKDRDALRRVVEAQWCGVTHLLQSLRHVGSADGIISSRTVLPYLKDQGSAWRRIVPPAIDDPRQTKRAANVFEVGIVAYQKQQAITRLAQRAGNCLPRCGLLHRIQNVPSRLDDWARAM